MAVVGIVGLVTGVSECICCYWVTQKSERKTNLNLSFFVLLLLWLLLVLLVLLLVLLSGFVGIGTPYISERKTNLSLSFLFLVLLWLLLVLLLVLLSAVAGIGPPKKVNKKQI